MDALFEYRQALIDGILITLALAFFSLLIAVGLGLLGALAKLSERPAARACADGYTTVVRGVPDLVLMLLVFFGGQQLLNSLGGVTGWWDYIEVNQFIAGVFTIGVIFGAYMTESFRGAILAIPRGQIEAGLAYGMTSFQVFYRIIAPQMVRYALPSFTNNWLVQLKTTALVSVIGLHDVVYNAFVAGRTTRQLFTFMFAVLVIYLVLTAISDVFLRWLGRYYSKDMRSATR
ncbi:MAG: ABC transporter permease subunit [Pseudomonadota bacterium]